jgi:hypothetical protein
MLLIAFCGVVVVVVVVVKHITIIDMCIGTL